MKNTFLLIFLFFSLKNSAQVVGTPYFKRNSICNAKVNILSGNSTSASVSLARNNNEDPNAKIGLLVSNYRNANLTNPAWQLQKTELTTSTASFTISNTVFPTTPVFIPYYFIPYCINAADTFYSAPIEYMTVPIIASMLLQPDGPTGKTWLDRNLGATAINGYGYFYQFGRPSDGHQKVVSSPTTSIKSDNPENSNFIISNSSPYDWRNNSDSTLWKGVDAINNPCPYGYRLPNFNEWKYEDDKWTNFSTTASSRLKLPMAGKTQQDGSSSSVGSSGMYWSSSVNGTSIYPYSIQFNSVSSNMQGTNSNSFRAHGFKVRCVKD